MTIVNGGKLKLSIGKQHFKELLLFLLSHFYVGFLLNLRFFFFTLSFFNYFKVSAFRFLLFNYCLFVLSLFRSLVPSIYVSENSSKPFILCLFIYFLLFFI